MPGFDLAGMIGDGKLATGDPAHVPVGRYAREALTRLGIWDAVILSAAADARCRLLLSEDLQDGFTWRGVTVVNPFASSPHRLLAALLA